ncbi:hypothetical protein [Candidatus Formimonas warabiya]|uniref:Uncharacterized protein n=1 Tax=Formimonas warabiya TaxID=1761012 RepID=A0A3G1KQP1_FORW1|nr:hypothetical protein [Candidatus Formimonas warabiya]ATW24783.1 hypothetical protein DCMF_08360 [Candidatus Formimonas warabiya]
MFSVLALEIDGEVMRSAVVTLKGLGRYGVSHCYEIKRLAEIDEPPSVNELAMITAQIPNYPQSLVLVTPQAMLTEVPMEKAVLKKSGFFQKKGTLVRESEAFTGYAPEETFNGWEKGRLGEEEGYDSFWVTGCLQSFYLAVKETAEDMGLKLKRIYPAEVCFPVAALYLHKGEKGKKRLVLDVGPEALKAAWLEKGKITDYRTLDLSLPAFVDDPRADEGSGSEINEFLDSLDAKDCQLVLTGSGGREEGVRLFLQERLGLEPYLLSIPLAAQGEQWAGSAFSGAVGAALREFLCPNWNSRNIGISDAQPLVKRYGDKIYLIPAGILLFFFLFFGGHYWFIKYQIKSAAEEMKTLTQERDSIKAAIARVDTAEKEMADLDEKQTFVKTKLLFLKNRIPDYDRLLYTTLAAMKDDAPEDLNFVNIQLLDTDDQYLIAGESLSSTSVHDLALALQQPEWSEFAKVEEIVREDRKEKIEPEGSGEDLTGEEMYEDNFSGLIIGEEEMTIGEEEGVIMGEEGEEIVPEDLPPEEDSEFAEEPDVIGEETGLDDTGETAPKTRVIQVYVFRIRLVMNRELVADLPLKEAGK